MPIQRNCNEEINVHFTSLTKALFELKMHYFRDLHKITFPLMKLSYKLMLAAAFIFSLAGSFAQKKEWPVRFANGNFITGNNVEKGTFKEDDMKASLFGDKYFVLIQFSELPSAGDQEKLKNAGVTLNNYLPEHTYLAAVANTFDFASVKNFNIISINSVPAFYKINKKLIDYEPTFIKDQEQALAINYFEQADKYAVATELKR
jgi:hypothetical protein